MQSPKRVLGIEGGGTKTDWVMIEGSPGKVVERGRLPASNLRLIGDRALAQMFAALPGEADAVGAFLAGCATAEDRERLERLVRVRWSQARIRVGSDRDSAMAAAFRDRDGIVVISGTGAAVHGRHAGREEKAGGWGQLLGDRGGGYHVAMQGLRAVLSHFDLNQTISPLAETLLHNLGLNRLQDLVQWAMQADKMSVARLAPCIFEAARFGEPAMLHVVQDGANTLAEFTRAVAQRLESAAPEVRLFGGLFAHHPDYVALYKYRLSVLLPLARVELCSESGAIGAAWLALQPEANAIGEFESLAEPDPSAELAIAATEAAHPLTTNLENLSVEEVVEMFLREEDQVAGALRAARESLGAGLKVVGAAMKDGGRLFYVGAGTSGRLGVLDASEIPPTFGTEPELVQGIMAGGFAALYRSVEGAEDDPHAGAFAVLERGVRRGDVVCGIAASGRTPFVLGALERAREHGAYTVLLTCNPLRQKSPLPWDVEIDLPTGPEILTGSTRLKAGTACKVALNLLSTGAMIQLGRVRGNAMIDLNVSNQKLQDRAIRLVERTLGLPRDEARERLIAAQWNVRACLDAAET